MTIIYYFITGLLCLLSACHTKENKNPDNTNQSDSLYTDKYITHISLTEPYRALELLDTVETKNLLPSFQINNMRAMIYGGGLDMPRIAQKYNLLAYRNDSIRLNPQRYFQIIKRMADMAYKYGDYKESIKYATEGIAEAQRLEKESEKAQLLFTMAESLYQLKQKEAWEYFSRSIEYLETTEDVREMAQLSYAYGEFMAYLLDDKRYEQAIAIGQKREKLIAEMATKPGPPRKYIEQQYGYVYSKLAFLYAKVGNRKEAAKYYELFNATHFNQKIEIIPYWLATNQYKNVLDFYASNKEFTALQQDTITPDFLKLLNDQAKAYEGIKDYKSALSFQKRIEVVMDSLSAYDRKNAAIETATIYKTNEKDKLIRERTTQLEKSRVWLICFISLAIVLSGFLYFIIRYNYSIRRKNRIMAKSMEELITCHDELFKVREKMRMLLAKTENATTSLSDEANKDEELIQNQQIFEHMNHIILKEKLYLNPNLSRECMIQQFKLDKNKLAKIIKENTGDNLNTYIASLRIEHAISLLKQYPEYTIQAISEESGITNIRTFQRLFQLKTGMTPTEYRNAITS